MTTPSLKTIAMPSITEQRHLFGVNIDAIRMPEAIRKIRNWVAEPGFHCHYVVTPNVDHTVLLQHHEGLQHAYRDAGLILADGHPLVLASRILGQPLPERVAGSDLVPSLFETMAEGEKLRVFLLGAACGVGVHAAMNIHRVWPNVEVAGRLQPSSRLRIRRRRDRNHAGKNRVGKTRRADRRAGCTETGMLDT